MTGRWKVERAGSPDHWLPGWITYDPSGSGASFPSWAEAFAWAYRRASVSTARTVRRAAAREAQYAARGVTKLRARVTIGTDSMACRAELHELCAAEWCACRCHEIEGEE